MSLKVNITMNDNSELKEVYIFKNKELGDSVVPTKQEIKDLLDSKNDKNVYFSGKYVQGCFIPRRILEYQIIDDEEDTYKNLFEFLQNYDISTIFGVTTKFMTKWIMKNREQLLKILK